MCYFHIASLSLLISYKLPYVILLYFQITPTGAEGTVIISSGHSNVTQNNNSISELSTFVKGASLEEKPDIFKIEAAASLMRKSLNESSCNGPSWLLSSIRDILAEPVPDLKMHGFVFEN